MRNFPLRYSLLTSRLDQIWFPVAFWILFALTALLMDDPAKAADTARAFLGVILPLIGGMMASYAVLDDPALELRFAAPIPAARTLLERLGVLLLILSAAALSFQAFTLLVGGDLSVLGDWGDVQLAWILPTLTLMGFGCLCALLAAQTGIGAALVGLVWILELILRGWLAQNAGKYMLIFMGALLPGHPNLPVNRVALAALTSIFLLGSWILLHRQERYL